MVTQKDIADRLNVSRPLVSLVLNGKLTPKQARPEVVEAIKKAAVEMGYQPNLSALAFVSGSHQTIGVYMRQTGTEVSGIMHGLITGITSEAERHNQKLWVKMYHIHHYDVTMSKLLDDVNPGAVDGVIVGGRFDKDVVPNLKRLQDRNIPVVFLERNRSLPKLVGIDEDSQETSYMATNHLIEQGCTRIVHFDYWWARTAGYREALKDAGIRANKKLMPKASDFRYKVGYDITTQLLADGVEFDGISAQSDEQAAGAMNALLAAGVKIPEQVKIIGIDDSPYCKFTPVPLSSVYKREEEKGELAVKMVLDMVAGKDVKSVALEPELRVRESTGK